MSISSWISEAIDYRRLAKTYSSELSNLVAHAKALRIAEMRTQLAQMKRQDHKRFGVLQQADGKPLNLCPRCGFALRDTPSCVETLFLECTNNRKQCPFPFTVNLPLKHECFSELRVT